MVFFLYTAQKTPISVALAASELEHFMSDIKVIQKLRNTIPGNRNPDRVETASQFPKGALIILFPVTWQVLFPISAALNAKIHGPITCPSQKERKRNGISGPSKELCQRI